MCSRMFQMMPFGSTKKRQNLFQTDMVATDTLKLFVEGLTLFSCGLVSGGMCYITMVEVPGRKDLSLEYQLKNYHQVFPRAARIMKPSCMMLTGLIGGTIYLTKKSMWWIPMTMFGALAPFTAIAIQPTNAKLMGTAEKDASQVGDEVASWGKLHNIRTCMSLVGFAAAVAAVLGVGV